MEYTNYRHGDLCLIGIGKLPEDLKANNSSVLFEGKTNTHGFKGGTFYPKVCGDFVIGYIEAKNTSLLHPDHGGLVKIKDGFYEVRRQHEDTNQGMKPVVD